MFVYVEYLFIYFYIRLKTQPNINQQEEETEDHDIIQSDLIFGLLRTGFLGRIRYLLEVAIIPTHVDMVRYCRNAHRIAIAHIVVTPII
jgi:hypothetical protein